MSARTQWHTPDSARDVWPDAPLDDEPIEQLLDVARSQVLEYAPAKATEQFPLGATDVPAAYVLAQLRQAQNLWAFGEGDGNGNQGDGDGFVIRIFPLDNNIRKLIRPVRAVPRVR